MHPWTNKKVWVKGFLKRKSYLSFRTQKIQEVLKTFGKSYPQQPIFLVEHPTWSKQTPCNRPSLRFRNNNYSHINLFEKVQARQV